MYSKEKQTEALEKEKLFYKNNKKPIDHAQL